MELIGIRPVQDGSTCWTGTQNRDPPLRKACTIRTYSCDLTLKKPCLAEVLCDNGRKTAATGWGAVYLEAAMAEFFWECHIRYLVFFEFESFKNIWSSKTYKCTRLVKLNVNFGKSKVLLDLIRQEIEYGTWSRCFLIFPTRNSTRVLSRRAPSSKQDETAS